MRPTGRCAAVLAAAAVCAAGTPPAGAAEPPAARPLSELRVAVMPIDNLTGRAIPGEPWREEIVRKLRQRGLEVADQEALDQLLAERRVRWVGGIPAELARQLEERLGADAALITHVDLFDDGGPLRFGLTARLVAAEPEGARVLWATGVALAGEESPGLLDLGLIDDPLELTLRGLDELVDGVAGFAASGTPARVPRGAQRRFRPRAFHRPPDAARPGGEPLRVAVLPFSNDSTRRQAGEIVGNRFVAALVGVPGLAVVDPGEVRRVLLETRLIQEGGLTYAQADLLREFLGVDLVVTGTVFDLAEPGGVDHPPIVAFSTLAIDARRRQVAWIAYSSATGKDRVYFFGAGEIRSSDRLLDEMIRGVLDSARR